MKLQALKYLKQKKGFTLIELMFSVFICAFVLVAVIQALVYLTATVNSNKIRSQVFQDMQTTMERIGGTTFSNLTTTFPSGQALTNTFVTNVLGGYKAVGESIAISYPGGTAINPIEVLVTAQWSDRNAVRNGTLRTFRRG